MKKILPISFLACILLVYLLAHRGHQNRNYNLDFEQTDPKTHLPQDWGFGPMNKYGIPADKNYAAYHLDSVTTHHGMYSLCIDWTNPSRDLTTAGYIIRQVYKGRKIRLTGFMKTENVTDGYAGLWMRLDSSGYSLEFNNMADRGVTGTTDWTEYTIELPYSPSLTNHILFGGLISGRGKIWLDDFHLYIDDVEIANASKMLGESYDYVADKMIHDSVKADLDTTNLHGSGLDKIVVAPRKIVDLKNLCMIWGLLKYHHEDVARGDFNMDAELFRILPQVLHAPTTADANAALEKWVDQFGVPSVCVECKTYTTKNKIYATPDCSLRMMIATMPESLQHKLTFIMENPKADITSYYYSSDGRFGQPTFSHEFDYPDQSYPDAGVRLLALFRYWNVIENFYPYHTDLKTEWADALDEAIPLFLKAENDTEYHNALCWLIARTRDSHGKLMSETDRPIPNPAGMYTLPFAMHKEGTKWVVTTTNNATGDIKAGDEIVAINGRTPAAWLAMREKYLPTTLFAPHPENNGALQLLSNTPLAQVQWVRAQKKYQAAVNCEETGQQGLPGQAHPQSSFEILNGKIGYIRASRLSNNEFGNITARCEKLPDLLLDLRGETRAAIDLVYSKWLAAPYGGYDRLDNDPAMPGYISRDTTDIMGSETDTHYKGRFWILVDATTGPRAALAALTLASVPGCKVMGETPQCTIGTNNEIILPGSVKAVFTSTGYTYPNGRDPFVSGLKIDIPIESGKYNADEVLV